MESFYRDHFPTQILEGQNKVNTRWSLVFHVYFVCEAASARSSHFLHGYLNTNAIFLQVETHFFLLQFTCMSIVRSVDFAQAKVLSTLHFRLLRILRHLS